MNRRILTVSLVLALAGLAAGCGLPAPEPTAAPRPSAVVAVTVVPLTSLPPAAAPATLANTAVATVAPSVTTAPTVLAPTVAPCLMAACTATPAATMGPGASQPAEAILILEPGNTSSVVSPVHVSGEADPTFEQNLVIQITTADGRVLATQPTTIQNGNGGRGAFEASVPFTVSVGTAGRISVYSTSARDGGLTHLASVEVTLAGGGDATIALAQPHPETHVILQPAAQASLNGGAIHVTGFSDYVFEGQLTLELCGEGGTGAPDLVCGTADNVLATGTATLSAPDVGQPGPFAGDLSYHISAAMPGRVVVFSRSARDGGLVHLSSVPVMLAP